MSSVIVTVTRIIETTGYPLWVECKLIDAYGNEHIFRDKMPIFLKNDVSESDLPADGEIRCTVLSHKKDILRIDTSAPDDVESQNGETIFDVYENQILSCRFPAASTGKANSTM